MKVIKLFLILSILQASQLQAIKTSSIFNQIDEKKKLTYMLDFLESNLTTNSPLKIVRSELRQKVVASQLDKSFKRAIVVEPLKNDKYNICFISHRQYIFTLNLSFIGAVNTVKNIERRLMMQRYLDSLADVNISFSA